MFVGDIPTKVSTVISRLHRRDIQVVRFQAEGVLREVGNVIAIGISSFATDGFVTESIHRKAQLAPRFKGCAFAASDTNDIGVRVSGARVDPDGHSGGLYAA